MSDDRASRASDREIFEAIVSQLDDPELVRLRRTFLLLGIVCFVIGAVAVALLGGLGWPGFIAYSSTFVPGVVVARRICVRRFGPPVARRR